MSAGFKVWDLFHNDYLTENPHVGAAAMGIAALFCMGVAYKFSTPKAKSATLEDHDLVPAEKFSIRSVLDVMGSFVHDVAKDNIGHHYERYVPLLMFIFTWTLVHNLMGVIPGFGSTTTNLNTTLATGVLVFLFYNIQGILAQGLWGYILSLSGHLHGVLLLFLGPLMFVIESVSHLIRPFTLGLRLRSVMSGDHMVHEIFVGLASKLSHTLTESLGVVGTAIGSLGEILIPVPFVVLGLLVCVLQAFVFTLLTSIYIGLATAHEEH